METKQLQMILKSLNSYTHSSQKDESVAPPRVAWNDSRPNPSQEEENGTSLPPDFISEYHLTVRTEMTLNRKQASLLLAILSYQSIHFGVNLGMYLSLEHLSSWLLGNKKDPWEIKDKFVRDSVFVSQIILRSLGYLPLNPDSLVRIPGRVRQGLLDSGLIMSKRTYGSRFSVYRPERLLSILAVPVNIRFERIKGNSERYSSYCKGYGESHPSARRQRTKPSSELDGEDNEREDFRIEDLSNLLLLTQLEVRAQFEAKSRRNR